MKRLLAVICHLAAFGFTQNLLAGAAFSDDNWSSISGLPGAAGTVYAAAVDGSGNLYIGGSFGAVGGVFAKNIAKWNGTNWSPVGLGVNETVLALAVSGTNV